VLLALAGPGSGTALADGPRPDDIARMKAEYRRPPARAIENSALVDLGRDLFFDPIISATGKTSCATCHRAELGWAANEPRSITDSGRPTQRKTQTLLGIGHARPPFDWDGRHATLEAQAVSSIGTGSMSMFATPTEVKVDDIVARLRSNNRYVAQFAKALPGAPINLDNVVIALAAFQRSIEPGQAPFDRWIEGDETAIPEAAKRGFVLFHTEAACAGCHHGWRFTDDAFHDVGTSTTDPGRGREVKHDPRMQFAFKTPTLRSVALRAPYLHDGSAATLRDVVDLYVKGGIDRPSRSPMINPFELTEQERDDLVAFMQTLTGEDGAK
jgi:cytochrome c peroxidase